MFIDALRSVREIHEQREQISLLGDGFPVSIDDLKHIIEEMFGVRVTVISVLYESSSIRAAMYRYSDHRIFIYLSSQHSQSMERFATAKELAHIIMDEDENRSPDGAELVEALTTEMVSLEEGVPIPGPAEVSELIAPIIAIELLYPFSSRQEDAKLLRAGRKTEEQLAAYYDLPVFVIATALSEASMQIAEKCWALVNSTTTV